MRRLLNVILGLLTLFLGWRLYAVWTEVEPTAVGAPRDAAPQGLDLPSTTRTPAPADLATAIASRDLFDPSRRPPSEAPAAEAAPAPPPTVTLVGVLAVGDEREALIVDAAQGSKLLHVREEDDVSGYRVSRISPTEVILTSPAGEEVPLPLTLDKGKGAPAAGRPGAPPRPATTASSPKPPASQQRPTAAGTVRTPARPAAPPAAPTAPQRAEVPKPRGTVGSHMPSTVRDKLRELRQREREERREK
jgi:hypothetical protein